MEIRHWTRRIGSPKGKVVGWLLNRPNPSNCHIGVSPSWISIHGEFPTLALAEMEELVEVMRDCLSTYEQMKQTHAPSNSE